METLRRRLTRSRSVKNMFIKMSENVRRNELMSLYLKFVFMLFHIIFWTLHCTINLMSAFVKPEVHGNQVYNASRLAFGNMIALTSPLIIMTFGKVRRRRQVTRLHATQECKLRMKTSFRNTSGSPSNLLDKPTQNKTISEECTASKQISNRFRSANVSQNCKTHIKPRKRVLPIGRQSVISLPTHVEVVEENTPSTSLT